MAADEAKADEAAALRALADAHSAVLWRYVVHLTGDQAGADDVVQETLLRAWRSPRSSPSRPRARAPGCSPSPATW